jgi:hypothetical protein
LSGGGGHGDDPHFDSVLPRVFFQLVQSIDRLGKRPFPVALDIDIEPGHDLETFFFKSLVRQERGAEMTDADRTTGCSRWAACSKRRWIFNNGLIAIPAAGAVTSTNTLCVPNAIFAPSTSVTTPSVCNPIRCACAGNFDLKRLLKKSRTTRSRRSATLQSFRKTACFVVEGRARAVAKAPLRVGDRRVRTVFFNTLSTSTPPRRQPMRWLC